MQYIYKRVNDTYVVWFCRANRYMQLQEPAFRVLEDWSQQLPEGQIIRNCAIEFRLGLQRARRFVRGVTGQLQMFHRPYLEAPPPERAAKAVGLDAQAWFSARYYRIHGRVFRFRYGDQGLEELIHPGFAYLEQGPETGAAVHGFDLWSMGQQLVLQTGGFSSWQFRDTRPERFVGHVYLQLINCLYDSANGSWMGAVHASAVTAGQGAVLLTAPSGSGKSTLAALLMSRGYQVLSDDFSPLLLDPVRVFGFPEAISVKSGSLGVLQPYYPCLGGRGGSLPAGVRELHLPLGGGVFSAPVRALVFLQYDPREAVAFEAIPNLEAMDRFMRQLWLIPNGEVAARFMDWYFQVPCYGLRYGDHEQAIGCVASLLR